MTEVSLSFLSIEGAGVPTLATRLAAAKPGLDAGLLLLNDATELRLVADCAADIFGVWVLSLLTDLR